MLSDKIFAENLVNDNFTSHGKIQFNFYLLKCRFKNKSVTFIELEKNANLIIVMILSKLHVNGLTIKLLKNLHKSRVCANKYVSFVLSYRL